MKTKNERSEKAQTLISAFNVLWNQSLKNGELTYVDMVRISDIVKHEGSKILEEPDLPKIIHSGLLYAQASVDPNKERSKATMKKAASLVGGTGGLALISVAVGALVAPSKWAIVVAFFYGWNSWRSACFNNRIYRPCFGGRSSLCGSSKKDPCRKSMPCSQVFYEKRRCLDR